MGVSARIVSMLLMISAASAGPARKEREHLAHETRDLMAESSEIIAEAILPPHNQDKHKYEEQDLQMSAARSAHSIAARTARPSHSLEPHGRSQTLFPSFANLFESRPLSTYRIGFGNQDGAFSQRPASYRSLLNFPVFGGYRNVENFNKQDSPAAASITDTTTSLLGSGNFGIIRGGTFNSHNDEGEFGDGFNFYNNGHGRPLSGIGYIANPRPNYNQEQFANFRDFADINTPSNSAYSHFVVVYANKNTTSSVDEVGAESRTISSDPKNIIETLERLDKKSPSKVSKSKAKLELTKQKVLDKKEQWKKTNFKLNQKHDPEEPLLALS